MSIDHIYQPQSLDQAIDTLSSLTPLFDAPSQADQLTDSRLSFGFSSGQRTINHTWFHRDQLTHTVSACSGLVTSIGTVIDVWAGPLSTELIQHVLESKPARVLFFTPSHVTSDSPEFTPIAQLARAQNWHVIGRHHYDRPLDDCSKLSTTIQLENLTGPDDRRLFTIIRDMMKHSSDPEDRDLVDQLGLEGATRYVIDFLTQEDPWHAIRLAFTPTGQLAGLVSWTMTSSREGILNQVCTLSHVRGRGYATEMVSRAVTELLQEGATSLIADTDISNAAMVRALATNGFNPSENRIDLVPTPAVSQ